MKDETLHRMTIVSLAVVALIAAIVSFIHIYSWATAHHQLPFAAGLYPFSVDALVAVTTFSMFRSVNRGSKIPKIVRWTLGLAIGATLAANFGYGLPFGFVSAAISCWPAVAFVCAVECTVKLMRVPAGSKKLVTPKIEVTVAPNGGTETSPTVVKTVRRAKKTKKTSLSNVRAAEIAAERGCSTRTVRNHPEWWTPQEALN